MQRSARSLLFGLCLLAVGCEADVVRSHYTTLADARADHLFGRGWLPDLLPPTASDIHTVNNLDHDTSTGSFWFSPLDGPQLFKGLRPGAPAKAPFTHWSSTVARYKEQGYSLWNHDEDDSQWAFFCLAEQGVCEYTSWTD